ncbi:MAG: hypothetical protein RLZ04_16 [Actinomycetota bacterium]
MTWVIVAAIVVIGSVLVLRFRLRSRQESGITNFRRHIDALSPEARREVMKRVRPDDDQEGQGL